jgi:hypothetical protein
VREVRVRTEAHPISLDRREHRRDFGPK